MISKDLMGFQETSEYSKEFQEISVKVTKFKKISCSTEVFSRILNDIRRL